MSTFGAISQFAISEYEIEPIQASSSASMPAIAAIGAGAVDVSGMVAVSMPALSVAGAETVVVQGNASPTLPEVTVAAAGSALVAGSASVSIGIPSITQEVHADIGAVATITMPGVTVAAAGVKVIVIPQWSGYSRRDADAYAVAMADELPRGAAWPRDAESTLMKFVGGMAGIWGEVDSRAGDLLERESDPRRTVEMLPDWERNAGLPEPCLAEPLTIADRQRALVQKLTTEGGQSREYFYGVARALGYDIKIQEYSPFMCGVSRVGDTRPSPGEPFRWHIGSPDMRFYWTVKMTSLRLSWFHCGSGQCGVDPMVRIGLATDLECLFRRWKPAQSEIVFDYSEAAVVT